MADILPDSERRLSQRLGTRPNNVLLAEMILELHIGILACCRPDTHRRLDRLLRLLRDDLMDAAMPEPFERRAPAIPGGISDSI